ncbi:hypothetical protein [Nonomuraea rubra]|uniref:hypothetical protein n=1 Tax=Nonomuraea rubra TaxID=46180 RepID=UPI0033C4D658
MTSKRAAGGRHRQGRPVPAPAPDPRHRPIRGDRPDQPDRNDRADRPERGERAGGRDRPNEAAVATVQFRQVRPATPPPVGPVERAASPARPAGPAASSVRPARVAAAPAPSAQAPTQASERPAHAFESPSQSLAPAPPAPAPPAPPAPPAQVASAARVRRSRRSIKLWVIAGVLAQAGLFAVTLLNQDADPTTALAAPAGTTGPAPASATTGQPGQPGQSADQDSKPRQQERKAGSSLAFSAVAGPSCPRDTGRSVNIIGAPGRNGWKDARAGGWTGAGCGEGFLFSDLTYDPATTGRPVNTFQWRFTTGLRGKHQCAVGVYIPKSGLAGQRVWYTVSDGFDKDARTVAEFTLDQHMRQGTWVAAPSVVTVTGGLVMVEIKDTGKGNMTGDQSMVAGPVRLSCV